MELIQVVPGRTSKRKNRWINANYSSKNEHKFSSERSDFIPPTFVDLPLDLTPLEVDQFLREQRIDELARKLRANLVEVPDKEIRDSSPDPMYDETGAQTNTREQVSRRKMGEEFARINRLLVRRIPNYTPPTDLNKAMKVMKKISLPNPSFIAVIVGPRGINHKKLQEESGCKIEIRGKNSSCTHQSYEEGQLDQHVHIEGDTDEQVETAVNLVSALLDVNSVEFKRAKMDSAEAMAIVAGTKFSPQPDVFHPEETGPSIKCTKCGSKGHVAIDCIVEQKKVEETIEPVLIPSTMIGAFIGQGGSNIKRLMIETGCNIQVEQSGVARGAPECPLIFHGPVEAISVAMDKARTWIKEYLERGSRSTSGIAGMTASGGFTDPDAAAAAVQMAYMQQMYWQAAWANSVNNS